MVWPFPWPRERRVLHLPAQCDAEFLQSMCEHTVTYAVCGHRAFRLQALYRCRRHPQTDLQIKERARAPNPLTYIPLLARFNLLDFHATSKLKSTFRSPECSATERPE